jgi:hypothetical protein
LHEDPGAERGWVFVDLHDCLGQSLGDLLGDHLELFLDRWAQTASLQL